MTTINTASEALEVLDPTAVRYGGTVLPLAARPQTLDGSIVGLLWNGKLRGDTALQAMGEQLQSRFPGVQTRLYKGGTPCSAELLEQVAAECDVVIGCTADCGSCSSWMTHDCIEIEKRGKPAVAIVSKGFEHDIEASARAFAMPTLNYVVVPKIYSDLDVEEAAEQTVPFADRIIEILSDTSPNGAAPTITADPEGSFTFTGEGNAASFVEFNRAYLERDWGDGYPLWAPTRDRVAALIDSVDGSASDIVCLLPPGNGEATVHKVAVNAAMAGCLPREMPVIMASLRAIAKLRPAPLSALMSTSSHSPMVMVNGPIARELGINGGASCLGPGRQNEVNLRIGRAILFCLKNLGCWYPGIMDLDTIGSSRKSIVVVAENEAESPWDSYHVLQGFDTLESTATVFFTSGEWDIALAGQDNPRQLAKALASYSCGSNNLGYFTTRPGHGDLGRVMFVPPLHAVALAQGGFPTKRSLEAFLHQYGREPVIRLIEPVRKLYTDGQIRPEWEWLFELSDEEARRIMLPAVERPELYTVLVVGSGRAKELLMPTRSAPYTELITNTPTYDN